MEKEELKDLLERISKIDTVQCYNTFYSLPENATDNDRAVVFYALLNRAREIGIEDGRKRIIDKIIETLK